VPLDLHTMLAAVSALHTSPDHAVVRASLVVGSADGQFTGDADGLLLRALALPTAGVGHADRVGVNATLRSAGPASCRRLFCHDWLLLQITHLLASSFVGLLPSHGRACQ